MIIKAVPYKQREREFFAMAVPLRTLVNKCVVDRYDSEKNPNGYQRAIIPVHARKFEKFISDGGTSPTSMFVNIRSENANIRYQSGNIEVPDNVNWNLVDGQHRYEGYLDAVKKDSDLYDFEVSLIVTNLSKNEEAIEFLRLNKTARGIGTDLAERIAVTIEDQYGKEKIINLPIEDWRTEASRIMDIVISQEDSPLAGMIKLANEKGKQPLRQVSFTTSLKPIIDVYKPYLRDEATVAQVIINMWSALKELCPASFQTPKNFQLLKSVGSEAVHKQLANMIPSLHQMKNFTKGNLVNILSDDEVSEYFTDIFWNSANREKGVTIYGSNRKAFKLVNDMIWQKLQRVVESKLPASEGIQL